MSMPGRPGWRPLAALTAVVVAAHLLALQEASVSLNSGEAPLVRVAALRTRSVTPPPPAAAGAPTPTPPKPPAPAPKPPRKPRPPAPPAAPAARPPLDEIYTSNQPQPSVDWSEFAIDSEVSSTPTEAVTDSANESTPATAVADSAGETAPATAQDAVAAPAPAAAASQPAAPPEGISLSATTPPSALLLYNLIGQARKLDYTARGEVLWRQDGQRYALRLSVSAFLIGTRTQTSEGDVTPQGLAPRRYADVWRGEQAAHFNRETQRITFSANTPDVVLLPGAQDRLSLSVQLGALLAANPARMAPGTRITLQTANTRAAEPWTFTADGEERLALPYGELQTFKFSRAPRREYDTRVEVWIAPSLNHAAVRIRVTQGNGDFVDQQLRAIERADDLQ